jgi:hypothetical protein
MRILCNEGLIALSFKLEFLPLFSINRDFLPSHTINQFIGEVLLFLHFLDLQLQFTLGCAGAPTTVFVFGSLFLLVIVFCFSYTNGSSVLEVLGCGAAALTISSIFIQCFLTFSHCFSCLYIMALHIYAFHLVLYYCCLSSCFWFLIFAQLFCYIALNLLC